MLVSANVLWQDKHLAAGAAGVIPATSLQVPVVQNPGGLVVVGAVHVGNDSDKKINIITCMCVENKWFNLCYTFTKTA